MGFGLSFNSGEFLPYIKINGKEGRIERSTYDGNERGSEIIEDFVALFDFATVRVGWLRFEGDAPDMRLVAIGDPMPDRPGEDYKQGIKLVVLLPGDLGPHELATTATGVLGALEKVNDQALSAPEWAEGQVPAVSLTTWTFEKTKFGQRAIPVFEIIGWKPRPPVLEAHRAEPKPRAAMPGANPSTRSGPRPATTGSRPVAPPAPKAAVDLDGFG